MSDDNVNPDFEDDFDDEDEDEFDHFVDAQDTVYDTVTAELKAGEKKTNWMWFVFPVLTDIDETPMAMFYSLRDAAEAREYAAHPVLGQRLTDCMQLAISNPNRSLTKIMDAGDAYKLRACATLFEAALPTAPVFARMLDEAFDGQRCTKTLRLLRNGPNTDPII